jgi:hypothetical protein
MNSSHVRQETSPRVAEGRAATGASTTQSVMDPRMGIAVTAAKLRSTMSSVSCLRTRGTIPSLRWSRPWPRSTILGQQISPRMRTRQPYASILSLFAMGGLLLGLLLGVLVLSLAPLWGPGLRI